MTTMDAAAMIRNRKAVRYEVEDLVIVSVGRSRLRLRSRDKTFDRFQPRI
jgi:hypothetical protein